MSQIVRQRDFSGGEIAPDNKRNDDLEQVRASGRSMRNWRGLASRKLAARPGRLALFPFSGRTETLVMPGDVRVSMSFGPGTVVIRGSDDAIIASNSGYDWTAETVGSISVSVVNRDVLMCFPGARPKVARREIDGTWTFFNFTFDIGYQGELKAPFYRFPETKGVTLQPSGNSGSITLTASAAVFVAGHVDCVFTWKGKQVRVTAVGSSTSATATVLQDLPPAQELTAAATTGVFLGQVVTGQTSGATGEVTAVASTTVTVQLKNVYTGFENGEVLVSPTSRITLTGVTSATLQSSLEWEEIAFSDYRGWPRAALFDRSRLAFFDLPQIPEGVIWSALGAYADFFVGADADQAIFELVPGRVRVRYLTGGPDQFVFTDRGIFHVPISDAAPLAPGSVAFVRITSDGCGAVQPVATPDGLLFCNVGLTRVIGIVQTGQQARPYMATDVSDMCPHLVKSPVCLAASSGDDAYQERYIYLVNGDGTMAVGRFAGKWIGWMPWDGAGSVKWVSSLSGVTVVSSVYPSASVVELLDIGADMDCQFMMNDAPTAMAPPSGMGPLWMFAGESVDLMDGGRDLGRRDVSDEGYVIADLGDDFSAETIVAGQSWVQEFEPFIPHPPEGPSAGQTQRRRRVKRVSITVQNSVGFAWGAQSVPAVDWSEDGANEPAPREQTYNFRELGRSIDPRIGPMSRERPGSITFVECSLEVTA